jgi:hypothetical protein
MPIKALWPKYTMQVTAVNLECNRCLANASKTAIEADTGGSARCS